MKYFYFFIFILFTACNPGTDKKSVKNKQQEESSKPVPEKNDITIIAVGDMMLGSDYPNTGKLPSKNILATLADTLKNAGLTVGNLEGVIASPSTKTDKCKGGKNCFVFRMPVKYAGYFKDAGFGLLNIANNHSGDFGNSGIEETMKHLKDAGIGFAGLKNICEYAIVEKNNLKIGFIGLGHGSRHIHINDKNYIKQIISSIKPKVDILLIFFHGGAEGSDKERVPKTVEFLHGENRGNVFETARFCVDAGADLVLGSGPHVTRGIELYKNKLIAYSLGNFATYTMSTHGPLGIAPILKLNLSKNGDFLSGQIIPTIQHSYNPSTPKLDPAKTVIKKIASLTRLDFPQTNLVISDNGAISVKNF